MSKDKPIVRKETITLKMECIGKGDNYAEYKTIIGRTGTCCRIDDPAGVCTLDSKGV